jgi:hypothetical protein
MRILKSIALDGDLCGCDLHGSDCGQCTRDDGTTRHEHGSEKFVTLPPLPTCGRGAVASGRSN